jgi:exodeoxyribonuclease V alpha subunit
VTSVATGPTGWSTDRADAVLRPLEGAGVVGRFEIQLVTAAVRAADADGLTVSDEVLLALALVARATRLGHVCLELTEVDRQVTAGLDDGGTRVGLLLPEPGAWRTALAGSPLVATEESAAAPPVRPLVLAGDRLYLQRYWVLEVAVARGLAERRAAGPGAPDDPDRLAAVLAALDVVFTGDDGVFTGDDGVFTGDDGDPDGESGHDAQHRAAARALTYPVTVIAGGPGTGKTHTVARILAAGHLAAAARGEVLRAALAAPTGKAANRMKESILERVGELQSAGRIDDVLAGTLAATVPTTIHRLLGARGRAGFRHDRDDPVPFDLVVIDETSMVSLPMLARLLDAVPTDARLVLVGDPFQLTSIEAGTVMGDMVGPAEESGDVAMGPLAGRVTELVRGHRFAGGSAMAALALAIRRGEADRAVDILASGDPEVHWVQPEAGADLDELRAAVVDGARQVISSALAGAAPDAIAAAQRIKVLAAVRHGPNGLLEWSDTISTRVRDDVPVYRRGGWPRVGTPVMVTGNDPINGLANGDVGVVVLDGDRSRVAMGGSDRLRLLAPARLGEWEPWWAMTIHKSQGSEFAHAVVALPTTDSPVLTRELLYTAVTRGKPEVTVVASERIVRLAIDRPVARASGLRDRLWPGT